MLKEVLYTEENKSGTRIYIKKGRTFLHKEGISRCKIKTFFLFFIGLTYKFVQNNTKCIQLCVLIYMYICHILCLFISEMNDSDDKGQDGGIRVILLL